MKLVLCASFLRDLSCNVSHMLLRTNPHHQFQSKVILAVDCILAGKMVTWIASLYGLGMGCEGLVGWGDVIWGAFEVAGR